MSMLTQRAPNTVTVCEKEVAIRTDFRVGIKAEQMLLDGELEQADGISRLLQLYFPVVPAQTQDAAEAVLRFYSAQHGNVPHGTQNASRTLRIYDYDADAAYIYAAFLTEYGIDLETTEHLHWWKFRAMFTALPQDCIFCKIMEYRAADLSKLKGVERAFYQKMKQQYALPMRAVKKEALDSVVDFLCNQP